MNTTLTTETRWDPVPPEALQHTIVIGRTRFWCIQPECDRAHHVWCSCQHAA